MKLNELVKEILQKVIPCSMVELISDTIGYVFTGFSKSGEAILYEYQDKIICKTRYGREDEINSWDDFLSVAWHWFDDYRYREPFTEPDCYFKNHFIEKGWIKEVSVTKYI